MSLFDRIFGKKQQIKQSSEYKPLTAYSPAFSSYNGKLYESELVRAAINIRATHISKLKIEFSGHGSQYLANRLRRPNDFQTWSQWLYRTSTILDNDNTAFIVPRFDGLNRIREIYTVLPQQCKVVDIGGEPWLAFQFRDGAYAQLPVWKVGVLTRMQYKKDFFGEDNQCLRSTMGLIDIQNQGIAEGVKSAATYRFMAQYNNVAFGDDLAAEQKRFNSQVSADGGMALLFPNNYQNIKQIDSKPFVVDADQMKLIQTNVYNYFGVSEELLQNKLVGDSWSAFYEGAVEPFAIQLSEVLTSLFTLCGELSGDAQVFATANRLQYMSTVEKLNVSSQLADRGILNRDEVREIWNLPPLPNGEGQAYIIRGEYMNASEHLNDDEKGDEENGDS